MPLFAEACGPLMQGTDVPLAHSPQTPILMVLELSPGNFEPISNEIS
jgi:hypothetical protein